MNFFRRLFSKSQSGKIDIEAIVSMDHAPVIPGPFGEKSLWICVKKCDIKALLDHFNLTTLRKASWQDGMKAASDDGAFVFDGLKDWILMIGWKFPIPFVNEGIEPVYAFLNGLSLKFEEVQYFVSFRTSSAAIWIRSVSGRVTRCYAIIDSIHFHEEGVKTPVEEQWRLITPGGFELGDDESKKTLIYPGIEEVWAVSESWSVNPRKMDQYTVQNGVGYIIDF